MSKKRTDIYSSLIILAGCVAFWVQTLKFEPKMPGDVGSGLFPQIVLACIIAMCLLKILLAFCNKDEAYAKPMPKKDSDMFRGILSILLLGAYAFLFKKVGFLLTSVFYLFFQLLLLSNKTRRSKKYILLYVAISVLLPVIIQIFFVNVLRLMLPAGILVDVLL
jgi:hypothetical protein